MPFSRRTFLVSGATLPLGLAIGADAFAQVKLDENDPLAKSLGYYADSSKVDQAKYPAHVAAASCSNCQLYQGKPADATGPCPIYAGKLVSAKGWCSAYVKKA